MLFRSVSVLRAVAGSLRGVTASSSGPLLGSAGGGPAVLRRGVARGHRQARVAALGAIAAAVLVLLCAQPALGAPPPVSFTGPINFPVGTTHYSVAVGDFNGDGTPDLAVANSGSNNVSVLLNTTPTNVVTTTTLRAEGLDLPHVLFTGKLVANVTPNTATGTIQFKQNGSNFGVPMRVTNGTASTSTLNLLFPSTYTAVFAPDNPAASHPRRRMR